MSSDPDASRVIRYKRLVDKGINPFGNVPFDMGISYPDSKLLDFVWAENDKQEARNMAELKKKGQGKGGKVK